MFHSSLAALLLSAAGLSLLVSPAAWAQTQAAGASPSDASASVPTLVYDSPFARYRAFAEQEVAPWKASNDNAGRIGGWRVYAREARDPDPGGKAQPAEAKPAPSEAKPAPSGAKPAPSAAARPGSSSHDRHPMMQGGRHE